MVRRMLSWAKDDRVRARMSTLAGDLGGLGRVDPAINIVFECGVAAGDGPRAARQRAHRIVRLADVLAIRGATRF